MIGPARLLLPRAHASARRARDDRRILREPTAVADRARPLLPGGRPRHPHDAALGGAAGVPRPARRAPDRRSADPRYAEPDRLLHSARALPGEIELLLAAPRARFAFGARALRSTAPTAPDRAVDGADQLIALAAEYEYARALARRLADGRTRSSTTTTRSSSAMCSGASPATCRSRRRRCAAPRQDDPRRADRASASSISTGASRGPSRAAVTSFERKRYASLSHERQQGDEPQQLHRADGRQLPRSRDADRRIALADRDGPPISWCPTPTTCSPSTPTA